MKDDLVTFLAARRAEAKRLRAEADAAWQAGDTAAAADLGQRAEQAAHDCQEAAYSAALDEAKALPMPWGEHRGQPLSDLPKPYLMWLFWESDTPTEYLRTAARLVLLAHPDITHEEASEILED